jgi:DNA polymerase-3 subunit alpha
MKFQTDEFYFKTPEEMKRVFDDIPEAISNTIQIAERCNLELDFRQVRLPHYEPPEGKTREQFLRELCQKGLQIRYTGNVNELILKRLEGELKVIENLGFTSYFLIVWDFVHYAKENNIPVGPGRGSAAGSLTSYLLGITDIDPLRYGLLFERFLNPERVSLPDIDIDFCYERRGEVINYVTQKYSKERVAQIITFGTMQARAVIRDVGRVMGMSYAEVDKIAKLVPLDPNISLATAIDNEPELKNLYKSNSQVTQLIDTSLSLEGLSRHASTHAAGVVISEEPLVNYIPLFKTSDDQITTGYPGSALEKIGLLKVDFLGLRTLTVIDETVKLLKKTQEVQIKIDQIPLDERKTFRLLSNAESLGVFQLESSGMRDLLRKLAPQRIEDIIALLALYRPGPIGSGMVDDFIKRKHGLIPIKYDHKHLEPILKDTYGIVVYQEQVMRIASELAGFSLSQADLLRRAMSKKTSEIMEEQRRSFVEGCGKNNIDQRTANKIFDLMEYFSGYGFNLSHSAAYALISYRTAYLKANYPLEFMSALLTSEKDNTDKIVDYINEAMRMGINILPPDINDSFAKFTPIGKNSIRFGLSAIKNVGTGAIESIIQARIKEGAFKSLYDFCEHVDLRLVNRKVIESLIKCGAFDSFGLHRSQLMVMLEHALEVASGIQKDKLSKQLSFFDALEDVGGFKKSFQETPNIKEWPESQMLAFEKEILGFYITGHPLARYERTLKTYASCPTVELVSRRDGEEILIGGIIHKAKQTMTRNKSEKMAILKLEDLDGAVEVLVFPEAFRQTGKQIRIGRVVFVKGKLNLRDEEPKVIANDIIPIEEVAEKYTSKVEIDLFTAGLEDQRLGELKSILLRHPGKVPVYLNLTTPNNQRFQLLVGEELYIQPNEGLIQDLEKMLGERAVHCLSADIARMPKLQ